MKGLDPWLSQKKKEREERRGANRETKVRSVRGRKVGETIRKEGKADAGRGNNSLEVGRTFLREYCLDLNENAEESSKQPTFLVGRT